MADLLLVLANGIGLVAIVLSLPGSVVLARWTWAARHKPAPLPAPVIPCTDTITVLVPAHNESAILPHTLPGLLAAAREDGHSRVVVIADNCSDATVQVAEVAGASVLERTDTLQRGKGYALAYAIDNVAPTDWYLVIDADTHLGTDYFAHLRRALAAGPDGVQTRYLPLTSPDDWQAPLRHWALQGFNTLRPRARARLNEPLGILGNGFALSAASLARVPYQAGSIVEDLEYQLAFTDAGLRMAWCEEAVIYGEMPTGESARTQRQRWEGGRFALLRARGPALMRRWLGGDKNARYGLEELLVLPLSFQFMLLLVGMMAPAPLLVIPLAGLGILAAHAGQALGSLPRAMYLPALSALPRYLFWKLSQLPAIWAHSRGNTQWHRSSRSVEGNFKHEPGEAS